MKKLGTDYIDLYQMHWPDTVKYLEIAKKLDISSVTLVVAYTKQFGFVTSIIVGARHVGQLDNQF